LRRPSGGSLPADFSVEESLVKQGSCPGTLFGGRPGILRSSLCRDEDFPKEPTLYENISVQFMKESKFIPAQLQDDTLTVIMADPDDFYTLDAIRLATKKRIQVLMGPETKIVEAIERSFGPGGSSMERIIEDMDSIPDYQGGDEENVDQLRDMASEGPVIRLVNLIITRAIEKRLPISIWSLLRIISAFATDRRRPP